VISFEDYRRPDGSIDWRVYYQARVNAGEACAQCGALMLFPKGHPQTCPRCRRLSDDPGEVEHEILIRCPACRHTTKVTPDLPSLYSEGDHSVICPECEAEFTVSSEVQFRFTSPPLVADALSEVPGG